MKYGKILAGLCAGVMVLSAAALHRVYMKERVNAADIPETEEEETRIYRTSVKGTCGTVGSESNKWKMIFTLVAYDSGRIHIDVQAEQSSPFDCGTIGDIVFDDSMIAGVGEKGYAGTSSFSNHSLSASKYTVSYPSDLVDYTAVYSNGSSGLSGQTLMSFDLYVKERYLTTNQTMTLFGTKITIPFGNPPIDKDARIAELEAQLEAQQSSPSADIDNNGEINAVDAQYILTYFLYNTVLDTPTTWDEIIPSDAE